MDRQDGGMSGASFGNLQERAPTKPMRKNLPTAEDEAARVDISSEGISVVFRLYMRLPLMCIVSTSGYDGVIFCRPY